MGDPGPSEDFPALYHMVERGRLNMAPINLMEHTMLDTYSS
jgi:hypothetical protein